MKLRSLLFVPGNSAKKFRRAVESAADAVILDLEDAVAPAHKLEARALVAQWLGEPKSRDCRYWVRVNALDTGLTLADLVAVVRPGLDAVLLPKANGAADIDQIGHYLDALEEKVGMPHGTVRIAVVATETPAAMFALGSYTPAHPRLIAMTWGAEDLGAAIGAAANKDVSGGWTIPYQIVRAQCLFAAASAAVLPIDTLYSDFKDIDGLADDCRIARRDGFLGRIAIHPDQVSTINASFSPSADDLIHARRVVAAFEAEAGTGTIGIDGKMYDIPHLKAAQRLLAAAD